MLVLNNINKSFKNIKVLKNISFTLQENKIFAFLGPNGVGKTTLIKIISGLISADSGTVLLDDKKISMDKISTMFDGSRNLYWNISVRENFYYFSALKGKLKKEVDYLLEKNKEIFQIDNLLDNLWSSMIVAMLVLFYFRVTNMGSSHNVAEDENNTAFTNYVVRALGEIYDNYHESIDLFCKDESCNKLLLYSILVYEDMNRPRLIRKIENTIVTLFKCELTVGIAQVKSKKPLTDVDSIKIAARILRSTNDCDVYDNAEIKRVVGVYNSGKVYAQTIVEIMNIIRQDSRIEDVNKLYQ